jgi:hypothetical protein
MKYEVIVDSESTVYERHRVTIEADSSEEAMDLAWEIVSDPKTELKAQRKFRERHDVTNVDVLGAEVVDEGLVQDGVFDDAE